MRLKVDAGLGSGLWALGKIGDAARESEVVLGWWRKDNPWLLLPGESRETRSCADQFGLGVAGGRERESRGKRRSDKSAGLTLYLVRPRRKKERA